MVDPATGAQVRIAGTDEYEWLAGGWFLVHRVDVTIGDAPVRVLELIGEREPESDALVCRSYDDSGGVTVMRASVDADGAWLFDGEGMRAILTIAPGGDAMSAAWERDAGGAWQPWMEMRFERIPAEPPGGGAGL